jgi:hypothetical protein
MANSYTKIELEALQLIAASQPDGCLTYQKPIDLETRFLSITGSTRRHGPLYMAWWRMTNRYYDDILGLNREPV